MLIEGVTVYYGMEEALINCLMFEESRDSLTIDLYIAFS